MSKNDTAPRPGFMQNLVTMAFFLLLFLVISNALRPQPDARTPEQILQALRQENAGLLDLRAAQTLLAYENKLGQQKLPQAQRDARELEARILVADTQLKGGIATGDVRRLNNAYMTLDPIRKRLQNSPAWTQTEVAVAKRSGNRDFKWDRWTGQALYEQTIATLHQANQRDLVMGIFPGYQLMDALVRATGALPSFSYWFCAFLLALLVRAVVFPLSQKQLKFGRQMSQLQPLIADLKEKYGRNPQEFNLKVMEMYREYGINPAAGCVPMLLQLPLFLLVYQFMLQYRFEFQKGYFLWINPSTSAATNGFVAPNLGEMDYILIAIYGISMVVTTMLTPVSDATNVKQQRLMGIGFALFFAISMFFYPLPSAFVLYWTFANVFATAQSLWVYRQPLPPLMKVNTPAGGVYPLGGNGKTGGNGEAKLNGHVKTGKPVQHKPKRRK